MLWQRLITGPLLIALVLGVVWLDAGMDAQATAWGLPPGVVLLGFAAVLSVLIAREITAFLRGAGLPASPTASAIAALLGLLGVTGSTMFATNVGVAGGVATALTLMLVVALLRMAHTRDPKGSLMLAGGTLLAGVYGGVLLGFWMLVRLEHSPWMLVGAVLVTKSCDIGAYFTGRAIGRHKMIPWLSPKKTWEGLAGGVLTATLLGAGLAHYASTHASGADRRRPGRGDWPGWRPCGELFQTRFRTQGFGKPPARDGRRSRCLGQPVVCRPRRLLAAADRGPGVSA
jgi:phosphatidate cytidylyltransferase